MTGSTQPLPVSVLIVAWNSNTVLPACLSALGQCDPPPMELVVIDNTTTDESAEAIRSLTSSLAFPVQVLQMETNIGFAGGMNRAIAGSGAPYVFLLNPDARLLPETLVHLCRRMDESGADVYAVGPKLLRASGPDLSPTDVLDSTGIQMTRDGRHFDRGSDEPDKGRYDAPEEVFGITGAAVMLRRSAIDEATVDGQVFDEDFFAYREDVDLAWRMRGFGYRALYEPAAVAYHQRRVTPSRRRSLPAVINYHSVKNRFLLRLHHADRRWLLVNGPRSLVRDVIVIGGCLAMEHSSLPAFPWLLRNMGRHMRRRREIMARRSVSSRSLLHWFT